MLAYRQLTFRKIFCLPHFTITYPHITFLVGCSEVVKEMQYLEVFFLSDTHPKPPPLYGATSPLATLL